MNRERDASPRYTPGGLCGHRPSPWPSLSPFPHLLNRQETSPPVSRPWEITGVKVQWKA